jgi:hypothetical protein
MEVVFVKRVRDVPNSPVGKCNSSRKAAYVLRDDTLLSVWRIHRPVPVRKANSVGDFQGLVTRLADRIFIGNVHRAIVENLLE